MAFPASEAIADSASVYNSLRAAGSRDLLIGADIPVKRLTG
jgi:hypothetical protein